MSAQLSTLRTLERVPPSVGDRRQESDPCYTLTKFLIRTALKGRKKLGEKHIACSVGCFEQEPVGRACCSVTFNSGGR